MRLTTIIFIISIMQVSATTFAQKISLSEEKAPLTKLFKKISQQSGYSILVTGSMLKNTRPVTINLKNVEVKEALDVVFKDQPLTYTINDKVVTVSRKEASFFENPVAPLNIDVKGKIVSQNGEQLAGANIVVKGTKRSTQSDAKGEFFIAGVDDNAVLVISYIGYTSMEVPLKNAKMPLEIQLVIATGELEEVAVASNGYQDIPRERSTGSFEVITAKMLEHSSSPNLLKRLEGITTSVVFNTTQVPNNSGAQGGVVRVPGRGSFPNGPNFNYNGGYSLENMTVRGKNSMATTNASGAPLVVIDGIANAYDISLLNPDDVESITILKDAASASIWGSRAANGVLVIKTKRGRINQPLTVTFNTNLSVGEKLDPFYLKRISTSDYIDQEMIRFKQQQLVIPAPVASGEPNPNLYSPVQIILDAVNKGSLSAAKGTAQIDALRNNDYRREQQKYLLKNPVTQNYSLNLTGGTSKVAYALSGGYSPAQSNTVNNSSDRINAAYNMQLNLLKGLNINAGVNYSVINTRGLGTLGLNAPTGDITAYAPAFAPYTRLADDAGNPLPVNLHLPGFLKALSDKYGNKILDNNYYPLNEIDNNYTKGKSENLGLTADLRYRLNEMFSASLSYNYNLGNTGSEQYYSGDSYYMRNLINLFTDPSTMARAIPLGGLLLQNRGKSHNQTIRGLVNFSKTWNEKHELNAGAGLDIAEQEGLTYPMGSYYGYDPTSLKTTNVRFLYNYPLLYLGGTVGVNATFAPTAIPNGPGGQFLEKIGRTVGQFLNVGYTYDSRYTVTGSVRKDGSNTFGNQTNRTGTPFYHLGAGWNLMNEPFYHIAWLPSLKLRYTFGYNGNTNPSALSEPRINFYTGGSNPGFQFSGLPAATVSNLENSLLRPERTGMHNIGLDFGFKGARITGSIEYYVKKTTDLIAFGALDPSLGFASGNFNQGDLLGKGIDIGLNSLNLREGKFSWGSDLHLSQNRVKVTRSYVLSAGVNSVTIIRQTTPIYPEGSNLSALYAYQWAGLSPVNGEARVFIKGVPSNDQGNAATLRSSVSDAKEIGSSVPVIYGNLGNTFQYAGFTLNFNILYKLGYYQRRPAGDLFLNSINTAGAASGIEYLNRWQKPGDELITNVPSLDYAISLARPNNDFLYQYADINTYKADNIRLQEVNLSYSPGKKSGILKGVRLYVNMPVNMIIWRANKLGLDPDVYDFPFPRIYTFGFSTQFK